MIVTYTLCAAASDISPLIALHNELTRTTRSSQAQAIAAIYEKLPEPIEPLASMHKLEAQLAQNYNVLIFLEQDYFKQYIVNVTNTYAAEFKNIMGKLPDFDNPADITAASDEVLGKALDNWFKIIELYTRALKQSFAPSLPIQLGDTAQTYRTRAIARLALLWGDIDRFVNTFNQMMTRMQMISSQSESAQQNVAKVALSDAVTDALKAKVRPLVAEIQTAWNTSLAHIQKTVEEWGKNPKQPAPQAFTYKGTTYTHDQAIKILDPNGTILSPATKLTEGNVRKAYAENQADFKGDTNLRYQAYGYLLTIANPLFGLVSFKTAPEESEKSAKPHEGSLKLPTLSSCDPFVFSHADKTYDQQETMALLDPDKEILKDKSSLTLGNIKKEYDSMKAKTAVSSSSSSDVASIKKHLLLDAAYQHLLQCAAETSSVTTQDLAQAFGISIERSREWTIK